MKCDEIRELLSLYIDNMLDDSQAKEVEEHLSSCSACRKEYNELKDMLDLLGQTAMVPVPDEFGFRLKKALKEEKQKMAEEGIILKPKKKNQWRIITSIAAVFAVGILSYGLYDNILEGLPFINNGAEQAGPAAQKEEAAKVKSGDVSDETYLAGDTVGDSASSSDGSVMMKERSADLQPMMANAADAGAAQTYGLADNAAPAATNQSAAADIETEAAYGAAGTSVDGAFKSQLTLSREECSRSLTGSGVERNAAAVQYFNKQIEEKLSGFDYQIIETSYAQTGEWQFRIFIFRGKDGNTYNEEILIIGKDGEITTICSNEFMGL